MGPEGAPNASAPRHGSTSSASTTPSRSPTACSISTRRSRRRPPRPLPAPRDRPRSPSTPSIRSRPRRRPAPTGALGAQLRRLGSQSAIYGLGGLVSRILAVHPAAALHPLPDAVRLRPRRDPRRADHRADHPAPRRHPDRVLPLLVRRRRPRVAPARAAYVVLVHDGAPPRPVSPRGFSSPRPIAELLFGDAGLANLVRASFVALWAAMNYEQLTWVFRVEQRPVAYVCASLANIALTVAGTLLLVVVLEKGAVGVIVGNFSGTLLVYLALLGYRREQLGLQFDRGLLREMNRFGLPLLPSALFLWMTNFSDRFFLVKLSDAEEVGLYSVGVRIASAMVLLLTAFRTAWPAFAYSIRDDTRGAPHVRVRPHVPRARLVVARRRPRSALAVARRLACRRLVRRGLAGRAAARVRGGRVRRLHRRLDRRRPHQADAVHVGRHPRRRRRQPGTQPDADPDVRDDGRRGGDGRGLQP